MINPCSATRDISSVTCQHDWCGQCSSRSVCHSHNLIWELHCPLINCNYVWQISGQCCPQIRLCDCTGWSGGTLSKFGILPSIYPVNIRSTFDKIIHTLDYLNKFFPHEQGLNWCGPYCVFSPLSLQMNKQTYSSLVNIYFSMYPKSVLTNMIAYQWDIINTSWTFL